MSLDKYMKMISIAFTICANLIVLVITALLIICALWTLYLANQGDTTLLGDPYYEDTILAPDRAFGPWLVMLSVVTLAIIRKIIHWRIKNAQTI